MVKDVCAYCGQTLQVVAGFCASCQAPVEIASQARFVARTLQAQQPPLASSDVALPPLTLPPAPLPLLPTRLLLGGGIVALALVVVAVSLRLGVNPIHALVPPTSGELAVSVTPDGPSITTITTGTTFTLHYAVTVEAATSLVTLGIAPTGAPARTMTERWPRGITQRSQSLSAVAPGIWHITVVRDGVMVRTLDLTISSNPTSLTNSSSNPYATSATQHPPNPHTDPSYCG